MQKIDQTGHKRASELKLRGQGLTEYIIIVALIAVAAIGVVGAFGGVVKDQFAAMGAALGGDAAGAKTANDNAAKAGTAAGTLSTGTATTLKAYTQ